MGDVRPDNEVSSNTGLFADDGPITNSGNFTFNGGNAPGTEASAETACPSSASGRWRSRARATSRRTAGMAPRPADSRQRVHRQHLRHHQQHGTVTTNGGTGTTPGAKGSLTIDGQLVAD